jgi:Na+/melibiose symporter-like transporter
LEAAQHWHVYLPVLLMAFLLMVPPIIAAEKKAKMKQVFVGAIALAALGQLTLILVQHSIWGIAAALTMVFTAFNILEASLPSLISKIAPLAAKGTAMGVFSSMQFLGAFVGASVGGLLLQYFGGNAVFVFATVLLLLWLAVASTMQVSAAVRTRLYHLPELDEAGSGALQRQLAQVQGVREVMVVAAECMACLKVDMQVFDEAAVEQLLKGA